MMKSSKIIPYFAVLIICCSAFIIALFAKPGGGSVEKAYSADEIIAVLKAQKQLATTEVTIRKMGVYDSETELLTMNPTKWRIGKRVCVVPVDVEIKYGIDLAKMSQNDLKFVGNDTVIVTLPQPEIIDKSFTPTTDRNEILAFSTGLRDNIGETTIQQIKNLAFNDVISKEEDVKKSVSLEIKNNTEILFTSLLRQIGLEPVFQYK